jgi:hypothetical protein
MFMTIRGIPKEHQAYAAGHSEDQCGDYLRRMGTDIPNSQEPTKLFYREEPTKPAHLFLQGVYLFSHSLDRHIKHPFPKFNHYPHVIL